MTLHQRLLSYAVSSRPSCMRDPDLEMALATWLGGHVDGLAEMDVAEATMAACPFDGATLEDYLPHVFTSPADNDAGRVDALVGLRFYGGDPARPFVDLIATTAAVDADVRADLLSRCLERYGVFSPFAVRAVVWQQDGAPDLEEGDDVDQWLLAGKVEALDSADWPPAGEAHALNLEPDDVERAADLVADWYTLWEDLEPWRQGRVMAADGEDLQTCAEAGGLILVEKGDDPVAVVAAAPNTEPTTGLSGWCMIEEVVDPDQARQGLGRWSQRALIHDLADAGHGSQLLYGTIDADNLGSIATAERCGRERAARFEFWNLTPM